jgi:hypothetical protein
MVPRGPGFQPGPIPSYAAHESLSPLDTKEVGGQHQGTTTMRPQRNACFRCGSTNCTTGKLRNLTPWLRASVTFEPDDASAFALTRNVAVAGLACLDCGHLELIIDISRARRLTAGGGSPSA